MKQRRYFKTLDESSAFASGLAHADEGHIHSIMCKSATDFLDPDPRLPYVVTWENENKRKAELPQEPEPMTPQEYVREHKGTRCPVCRNDDITGDSITVDAGHAYQEMGCVECLAIWIDCYELSGYDNLKR